MRSRDFCYWLQGFFELGHVGSSAISADQVHTIQKHLSMVFKHEIDPSMGSAAHQQELSDAHLGKSHQEAYPDVMGEFTPSKFIGAKDLQCKLNC